jgi:hypothetical protein
MARIFSANSPIDRGIFGILEITRYSFQTASKVRPAIKVFPTLSEFDNQATRHVAERSLQ